MQLTMSLDIFPVPKPKNGLQSKLWIDLTPEARMIGFTYKVEISQCLYDALQPLQYEEEYDSEQRLYDAIWLAHHYLCLEQRTSISYIFDFQHNEPLAGKLIEQCLRLRLEIRAGTALIGLLNDL